MDKAELKEVGKGLAKSWTVYVNLALLIAATLLQQEPELMQQLLGEHFATAVQLITAANLILRTKTEVQKP